MLPQGSPVHGECRAWGMPPEERACSATWEDSQRAEEVSGVKVKAEADLLTARVGVKRPRTLQEGQEGAASPPMRPQTNSRSPRSRSALHHTSLVSLTVR